MPFLMIFTCYLSGLGRMIILAFEAIEASVVMLIAIQISTLVNIIHSDVTSAAVQTSLRTKRPSDALGWLRLTIRLGINSCSSTEGCFSTAKDRNKMVDAGERFVFCALRIVLRWCRDISNPKKNNDRLIYCNIRTKGFNKKTEQSFEW